MQGERSHGCTAELMEFDQGVKRQVRGDLLEVVRGETFPWSRREMTRVGGGHQDAARGMGFER